MREKLIVIVMSILMVFTMMPTYMFAADNDVQIRSFSASFKSGATKVEDSVYVWNATNNNKDHRYTFRLNYALSGTHEFEPGKVEMRIPKSILLDRTGALSDYYDMSIPHENDEDMTEDTKYVFKEDGNDIVIYNRISVPAGETGYIEVSYLTDKRTYEYKDYNASGSLSEPFSATIKIEQGESSDEAQTSSYKVGMNTSAEINYTEKKYPTLYKSWSNSWGDDVKPSDDSLYYYLIWTVRTSILGTSQPYDFSLEDRFDNIDGEVVGYRMQGESTFRADSLVESLKTDYEYGRYDYVLTKHKKTTYEPLDEYEMKNNVIATVHPIDRVDPDTTANSRQIWRYKKPTYTKPSGHFMLYKYGNDYRDWYVQDSEDIRNFTLNDFQKGKTSSIDNLRYEVEQIGYQWPWTIEDGADWQDPENFGLKKVQYQIDDKDFYINSEEMDSEKKLSASDYYINKLTLNYYAQDAEFSDEEQSFVTKKADMSQDTVTVYVYTDPTSLYYSGSAATYNPQTKTFSNLQSMFVKSASGNTLYFNDNVKGYQLKYSNSHYMTDVFAYPYITLLDTENIKTETDDKDKVSLTNKAVSTVRDYNSKMLVDFEKTGTDYIIGVDKDGHIEKRVTGTKNSRGKKLYTISWESSAYEDYMQQIEGDVKRVKTMQNGGVFYDLLPKGGEFSEDSLRVYWDRDPISEESYTYEVKKNYKGSGRDLLIVRIDEVSDLYRVAYDTTHSWDAVKDYGIDVRNDVAYETGNEDIGDGYPDNGGNSGVIEFNNLDPDSDAERFLYARKTHIIDIITAANLGLNKKVKSARNDDYVTKTTVDRSSDYSYRVRFATTDITEAKDLIIFDTLENYTVKENGQPDRNSTWRGTLQSVDVSQIKALGAQSVIYYSSQALNLEEHHDLTENCWVKADDFGDIANAKSIAVDMRKKPNGDDFVLPKDTAVTMTINMISPDSVQRNSERRYETYNNIYLNNTIITEAGDTSTTFIHQDYTTVSYVPTGDLKLVKVNEKDHDEKIQGITFRLSGESDAGDDVDMKATSDKNGNITFKRIPVGEYALQEIEGTPDWLMDYTEYKVAVADDGEVTVSSLSKENGRYIVENKERIHGDLEFRKKSVGIDESIIDIVNEISKLEEGDDTSLIYLDGASYYIYELDETSNKALMFARLQGGNIYGKFDDSNVPWRDSYARDYLNGDFFNTHPTIGKLATTSKIKSKDIYTYDKVFLPSMGDFGIAGYDDVTVKGKGMDGLTNASGTWTRSSATWYPSKMNSSSSEYRIYDTSPSRNRNYPIMFWVDLNTNPQRNVSQTTFKLEGKSDYGADILEYATSTSVGRVTFKNLEKGTYKLTETKNHPDYIPETTEWEVVVDSTGNATIKDSKTSKNGEQYLENEPYHNFSLRKVDAQSGAWLEGAEFSLMGTSDRGTEVNMTERSNPQGRVTFDMLESGTYILQEIKCPDKYLLDTAKRIVTIDKYGNTTIEGIMEKDDQDFFKYPNERAQDGKIKIVKKWKDNFTGTEAENREEPEVTISTKEPEVKQGITVTKKWIGDSPSERPDDIKVHLAKKKDPLDGEAYAVFDSADGSLVFFRDGVGKYTNNQTEGTKTYYTGIETSTATNSFNAPWYTIGRLVQSVTFEDVIKPKSTAYWFYGMNNTNFTSITGLDKLDTSSVTDMGSMFNSCFSLTSLDLSHFDTSSVTNMNSMFSNCSALTLLDVNHFDTSNVMYMGSMFYSCSSLTSLDIRHFDTSDVTYMDSMFSGCSSLTSLDLSHFDTSSVVDIEGMFYNCTNLTTMLNIMKMPSTYSGMCFWASTASGAQITLKYIDPVTSTNIDTLVATKSSRSNVVNGGQGTFTPPDTSDVWNESNPSPSAVSLITDLGYKTISTSKKGDWHDNRNNTWSYYFEYYPEEGEELYVWEEEVSGYKSDAKESAPKRVEGTSVEIENRRKQEAYAALDFTDGSLTFFRSSAGLYTNGQREGNKVYYTGIETRSETSTANSPWATVYSSRIKSVIFEDEIRPKSTAYWFYYTVYLESITGIEKLDTSSVTDMSNMFYDCSSLTSLDVSHFDTSSVTDMGNMFAGCSALTSLDVSNFSTSSVTNMGGMFYDCPALTSLDVSRFDTSSVTNTELMFYDCSSLTLIDVSHFDTSKTTRMNAMFANCESLTNLDVSRFDTSSVTGMRSMFSGCNSLTSLDVSHFDTSSVTGMGLMFNDCSALTALDVSNFNTSSVTNMSRMFDGCKNLASIDVNHFDTNKVTNMENMFRNCTNLTTTLNIMNMPSDYYHMLYSAAAASGAQIALKYIDPVTSDNIDTLVATKGSNSNAVNGGQGTFTPPDTSGVYNASNPSPAKKTTTLTTSAVRNSAPKGKLLPSLKDFSLVEEAYAESEIVKSGTYDGVDWKITSDGTLEIGKEGETQVFSNRNRSSVTWPWQSSASIITSVRFAGNVVGNGGLQNMFSGLRNASETPIAMDLSNFDTSRVNSMEYMFNYTILGDLDLSCLDVSNVTSMYNMFRRSTITSLNLQGWDTRKVTTMYGMFDGHSSTHGNVVLDLSSFDTSNVTTMNRMFAECGAEASALKLNLSSFNTSKVTNMGNMFSWAGTNAANINLDLSNFDTSKVTYMSFMFNGLGANSTSITLDISSFDTSSVNYMQNMFSDLGGNFWGGSSSSAGISIALGEKSLFNITVEGGNKSFYKYGTLSKRAVHESISFNRYEGYDGSSPGWYKTPYSFTPSNESDMGDFYCTSDDSTKWVKVDDETWEYTFNVFDDESKYFAWENLIPDGYVTDTDQNHYQVINDGNGNVKQVIITNTADEEDEEFKSTHGDLKITKYVEGEASEEDRNRAFTFTITLSGMEGTQILQDIVFKDGVGRIHLKDGEEFTLKNLPSGTTFTVEEERLNDTWETSSKGASGTIEADTVKKASFTNTKKEVPKNSFKLKKNVTGSLGNLAKEFNFTVELTGLEESVTYKYKSLTNEEIEYKSSRQGNASISLTLRDDEGYEFLGLPIGATYQVTELPSDHRAKYEITDEAGIGEIEQSRGQNFSESMNLSTKKETVDADESITILYTNDRSVAINTNTGLRDDLLMLLLILLLLILVTVKFKLKKEKLKNYKL